MSAYLFAHFTGEHRDGEQVCLSLSRDGLHWNDLNGGRPVLRSDIGECGVRDPFLVRDDRHGRFYLIATDLRIEAGKGWDVAQHAGSRDLIVWESADLVEWEGPRACRVGTDGAGCVWAPEAVWDEEKSEFLVFWASMTKREGDAEPKQRIYAAHTADFRCFSEPEVYIERECHVIDTTIIRADGGYYRFSKDETTKNIRMDFGTTLNRDAFRDVRSSVLEAMPGVEGPEAYSLPDGRWCLIVDRYSAGLGYLPLISSNLQAGEFEVAEPGTYDMGRTKKRHGGVLRITDEEHDRLAVADWDGTGRR